MRTVPWHGTLLKTVPLRRYLVENDALSRLVSLGHYLNENGTFGYLVENGTLLRMVL